jgi:hypothetical protein
MAENEKDIPVKEQTDGSALVAYELEPDPLADTEEEKKVEAPANEESDDGDQDTDSGNEQDDENDADEITEDEREAIREARRKERQLKKELKKQREFSAQNKIKMLERHNAELAERLAKVENTAVSYQFAQIDKAIEDEATRVEYAKMKMLQAAQTGDAAGQVEFLEQLTEAKQRLQQAQHYREQQLEQAKAPKQNVPNEISTEVQQHATNWLKKNSWYDPQARDTDSRIAKVIDQELAGEGWDPSDSEYWEELDSRLSARLPHRYTSRSGNNKRSAAGPTASSRVASTQGGQKAGTITLSRERVQAIKDAGAWDDVDRRNKMIRAYASYDRANKG